MNITLPPVIVTILTPFAQMFSVPSWKKCQLLCVGSILCQGARLVTAALRVMGLSNNPRFEKYHRFLNRDSWSPLLGAKILLGLLIAILPPGWPLLVVTDETIERRGGEKINAKGCYRDAILSSEKMVVKCFGLKWLAFCLIVPLPWCKRPWALPFLTILEYPKKYDEVQGRKHKTSIDNTISALCVISRWLPNVKWTLLGDGGFACVRLIHACCKRGITLISRMRLDASLYEFPCTLVAGKRGRKPVKGKKIPSFRTMLEDEKTQWVEAEVTWYGGKMKTIYYVSQINLWYTPSEKPAALRWVLLKDPEGKSLSVPLFSTDINQNPIEIIEQFVHRFNIEITFEEVRAHLGVETQRQWSDKAIVRTTPLLMGLFSIVCLIAYQLRDTIGFSVRSAAWYAKKSDAATFSDIIAYVRRYCWASKYLIDSAKNDDFIKLPANEFKTFIDQLAYSP